MGKVLSKILFITTLLMAIMLPQNLCAHNSDRPQDRRIQWATAQARQIADSLQMSGDQANKFITDYLECQRQIWKLDTPETSRKHNSKNVKSDTDAEKILKARFEKRKKMNDILEKYYKKYSSYLSQTQIMKMYETERFMMEKNMKDKHFRKQTHKRSEKKKK